MHIVVLVEDLSGKVLLDAVLPKLLGDESSNSFAVRSYRGIGRIPKNLKSATSIRYDQLLNDLPRIIRAYGRTFKGYGADYKAAMVIICDLDDKCLKEFRGQLDQILRSANPSPMTNICIAIEEIEAWILGDRSAIMGAYPNAKENVLTRYIQDSVCGTWEVLADVLYKGGSRELKTKPWYEIGQQKSRWASCIAPLINIHQNESPSFKYFQAKIMELVSQIGGVT